MVGKDFVREPYQGEYLKRQVQHLPEGWYGACHPTNASPRHDQSTHGKRTTGHRTFPRLSP